MGSYGMDEDDKAEFKVKATFNAVLVAKVIPAKHGAFVYGSFKKKDIPSKLKLLQENKEMSEERLIVELNHIHDTKVEIGKFQELNGKISGIRR